MYTSVLTFRSCCLENKSHTTNSNLNRSMFSLSLSRSFPHSLSFSPSLSLSHSKCHRSASSFRNIDAMYKCWNKRTTSLKLGVIAIIERERRASVTRADGSPAFYRNIFPAASLARLTRSNGFALSPVIPAPKWVSITPVVFMHFLLLIQSLRLRSRSPDSKEEIRRTECFVLSCRTLCFSYSYRLCDLNIWGRKLPCCLRFIIKLILKFPYACERRR